ncbi:MAG: hypothetical protein EA350_01390, partial [Gemmatimonadales bacterium]
MKNNAEKWTQLEGEIARRMAEAVGVRTGLGSLELAGKSAQAATAAREYFDLLDRIAHDFRNLVEIAREIDAGTGVPVSD